jgi:hypothetical protein
MGARISIELQGLLNNPDVHITFACETSKGQDDTEKDSVNQRAKVNFLSNEKIHWFDVLSHNSKVSLEADFNFFRNEDGHKWLMRCLFEASVPFTVIPG